MEMEVRGAKKMWKKRKSLMSRRQRDRKRMILMSRILKTKRTTKWRERMIGLRKKRQRTH